MSRKLMAGALAMACAGTLLAAYLLRDPHAGRDPHQSHQYGLQALAQTLLPVYGGKPVAVGSLVDAGGAPFEAERLQGRWSLVFFGFTSCPDVCPLTLQLLSAVAQDSKSGVSSGTTQIVFVTVDPQRDTPAQLKSYLAHFDERIVGLTGSADALERFAAALGAASASSGSGGIDHSSSVFAVDPQGRVAGILLRPADPARIVADLNSLRLPLATHVSYAR